MSLTVSRISCSVFPEFRAAFLISTPLTPAASATASVSMAFTTSALFRFKNFAANSLALSFESPRFFAKMRIFSRRVLVATSGVSATTPGVSIFCFAGAVTVCGEVRTVEPLFVEDVFRITFLVGIVFAVVVFCVVVRGGAVFVGVAFRCVLRVTLFLTTFFLTVFFLIVFLLVTFFRFTLRFDFTLRLVVDLRLLLALDELFCL